ncbi:MAG: hypothetical protein II269_09865 [Bacteroidaceae bacterium]|nr:hypothetical protein [Bacteroidaceae bacterium]
MREKDKMLAGEIYDANYDKELIEERLKAKDRCFEYNNIKPSNIHLHTGFAPGYLGRLIGWGLKKQYTLFKKSVYCLQIISRVNLSIHSTDFLLLFRRYTRWLPQVHLFWLTGALNSACRYSKFSV